MIVMEVYAQTTCYIIANDDNDRADECDIVTKIDPW